MIKKSLWKDHIITIFLNPLEFISHNNNNAINIRQVVCPVRREWKLKTKELVSKSQLLTVGEILFHMGLTLLHPNRRWLTVSYSRSHDEQRAGIKQCLQFRVSCIGNILWTPSQIKCLTFNWISSFHSCFQTRGYGPIYTEGAN